MDGFIEGWAIQPGDTPDKIKKRTELKSTVWVYLVLSSDSLVMKKAWTYKSAKAIEILVTQSCLSNGWKKSPRPVDIEEDVCPVL